MRLVQNLPKTEINTWEHMKLYLGALQKPLKEILDQNNIETYFNKLIQKEFPETRTITFIRHLESKYNEYKELIKKNPKYKQFNSEKDKKAKEELAQFLMKDFFEKVGIDYETDLSAQGHIQGEQLSKVYSKLIKQHPEIFPDIIYISPYLRTRLTANYLLKNIEGLDIDLNKLTDEDKLEDLIIGSFNNKAVTIKIDERIRERDHWSNISPSFLREYYGDKNGYRSLLTEKQNEKVHYYTAPEGGESQVQTNARAKTFLDTIYKKEEYQNIMVISHHLTIIWALLSIFWGSFQSFYTLNELRKPQNGSFTTITQIPETEAGQENKFRVSGYNLSLTEE